MSWTQPSPDPLPQDPVAPGPSSRTNGFAIAALVFGVIGGVVVAVVLAIIALSQIKRTGAGGRGMARAALVLAGLWTLALVVGVSVAVQSAVHRDASGAIVGQGRQSAQNLRVGDCVADWAADPAATSVTVTTCSAPHNAEVYGEGDLPAGGSSFPGDAAVRASASALCESKTAALDDARVPADAQIVLFRPTARSWARADRHVTCLVKTSAPGTGSLRTSPATS